MKDMPEGALLHCYISEIRAKNLSRNGDMGADRADSFDAPQLPKEQKHYKLSLDGTTAYIVVEDQEFAESKNSAASNDGGYNGGGYNSAPARPQPAAATDGFMNIPDGIDEELPFN